MSNEFHWGGISGRSLCKAVLSDIWMVLAVMVITYLGLGIAGSMTYTPSYTSSTVIAVYPFNQMHTLESSSNALATVSAANEVFNSEMFSTGLKERLAEPVDFSLYSQQIDSTYILMLSASSSSPENAYKTLRTALDYYGEISSHLVGDNHLEILFEPDFPVSASNDSRILKHRLVLTLFMGFAMAGVLILMYAMRRTYKTASAVRRYYKNVRFFTVQASESDKHRRNNKRKSVSVPNQGAMKKTALELLQMLRAKNGRSILLTSAAANEGKTEIIFSLAREMADFDKSVVIIETDPEDVGEPELIGMSGNRPEYTLSYLLQAGSSLKSVTTDTPDERIKVISATRINTQDEFYYTVTDVERLLKRAGILADIILVNGLVWSGSREERIWKEAADTVLAVCRQDTADFYEIDQMMTDLQEKSSDFLGCVLYGF